MKNNCNRKSRRIFRAAAILIGFTAVACTSTANSKEAKKEVQYTVSCSGLSSQMEGQTVYMSLYDNNMLIDSAKIKDGKFTLNGTIPESSWARLDVGREYANFIAGEGDVIVDFKTHMPVNGNKVNMTYRKIQLYIEETEDIFSAAIDSLRSLDIPEKEKLIGAKNLYGKYSDRMREQLKKMVLENGNNGVGHYIAVYYYNMYGEDNTDMWRDFYNGLSQWIKERKQIERINNTVNAAIATSDGGMFADLEGESVEGKASKLSDYVGKGKYVLVDFWASWCGPCIAEAKSTLIPLHEKYKGSKNFMILGAATWDKKELSLKAITEHSYDWEHIIDLGMTPMEVYGFNGIPMIILFAPDGRIVKRNLRGNALVSAVESVAELPER